MPKFLVKMEARTTIEETWEVEAETEEAAIDAIFAGMGTHVSDVVMDDEEDRRSASVERVE